MYPNLKSIGIENFDEIERYTIRQEENNDILKIYFQKAPRDFFGKSVKFKFKRQSKKVAGDHGTRNYIDISEISGTLRHIVDELDTLSIQVRTEKDVKLQILDDLRHLENVVASKIKEIEYKLEKL
ncbi:MAG: DUF3461 family protein [Gammaproteobacteria bacterium]|nr:DUF3461 family protein [Gammaproteobacteria bacterium]